MGKITAQINVTPDGFCNHDDVVADDEFSRYAAALIRDADRVVLGRRSYDLFVAHWPQAAENPETPDGERELARAIVETPRTVVSRSLAGSDWSGTDLVADLDRDSAAALAEAENLLVLGSPSIIDQLGAWDLIDRYVFGVQPIVSGRGKRLAESARPAKRSDLSLAGIERTGAGVLFLDYRRVRG